MRFLLLLFLLLAAVPATAAPGVFTSVLPLAWFVERVAGDRVHVESLVGPGQNPHMYEPGPHQMARLAEAVLFFRVGVPYEKGWIPRIQAANPGLIIVDVREGLPLLPLPGHGHDADDAAGNDIDPHVWTDPRLGIRIAARIRDALATIDPDGAGIYAANFAAVEAELAALDAEIHRRLDGLAHRSFLVFHPSWGYYAAAYDLHQLAIERFGKEPGPRSLAEVIALARREGIRVILVQRQFSRKYADAVAAALGARVETVDPLARDYVGGLRQVTAVLEEALR